MNKIPDELLITIFEMVIEDNLFAAFKLRRVSKRARLLIDQIKLKNKNIFLILNAIFHYFSHLKSNQEDLSKQRKAIRLESENVFRLVHLTKLQENVSIKIRNMFEIYFEFLDLNEFLASNEIEDGDLFVNSHHIEFYVNKHFKNEKSLKKFDLEKFYANVFGDFESVFN